MSRITKPLPDKCWGFDIYQSCFRDEAVGILKAWPPTGLPYYEDLPPTLPKFVIRYVDNLTGPEIDMWLGLGLGLMTVAVARTDAMQTPTQDLGVRDGNFVAQRLHSLALNETGQDHYIDTEGCVKASPADFIQYVNAYRRQVLTLNGPGRAVGDYVGWGLPLTAHELYSSLEVTGYWASSPAYVHSYSPMPRGYRLVQVKENIQCGPCKIDVDFHQVDGRGQACMAVFAGP